MIIAFSNNYFSKFHAKNMGVTTDNITVLYPNPCYNEGRYEGTVFV